MPALPIRNFDLISLFVDNDKNFTTLIFFSNISPLSCAYVRRCMGGFYYGVCLLSALKCANVKFKSNNKEHFIRLPKFLLFPIKLSLAFAYNNNGFVKSKN